MRAVRFELVYEYNLSQPGNVPKYCLSYFTINRYSVHSNGLTNNQLRWGSWGSIKFQQSATWERDGHG
eukprot:5218981-Amphidinium_carterae.1